MPVPVRVRPWAPKGPTAQWDLFCICFFGFEWVMKLKNLRFMPNRKIHYRTAAGIGFVVGGISAYYRNRNEKSKLKLFVRVVAEAAVAGVLAGFAGILPDILEPATGPYHRKFFHSYVALVGLMGSLAILNQKDLKGYEPFRFVLNSLGLGYLVHLVQDSTTRKGLPVI